MRKALSRAIKASFFFQQIIQQIIQLGIGPSGQNRLSFGFDKRFMRQRSQVGGIFRRQFTNIPVDLKNDVSGIDITIPHGLPPYSVGQYPMDSFVRNCQRVRRRPITRFVR